MRLLLCLILGCVKPRRLVQVDEPSLPRKLRFAMACPRCGSYEPMTPEQREHLTRLQQAPRGT